MNLSLPVNLNLQSTQPIPYPHTLLVDSPWKKFSQHNGYQSLAKRMMIRVVSDLETAGDLWNYFSPNTSLFDEWEFRINHVKSHSDILRFILLYKQDNGIKPLAMLPLIYYKEGYYKHKHSWFGGYWNEDNRFFAKDRELIPLLLIGSPSPIEIDCILANEIDSELLSLPGIQPMEDKKYKMPLSRYDSFEHYLQSLSKKRRHNIRRDIKHINALNPKIIVNRFADVERLFELNIKRFGKPKTKKYDSDASVFANPNECEYIRQVIQSSGSSYNVYTLSTEIAGKVEAVEFGCIRKNVMYSFISGVNIWDYPGLGVFSNVNVIKHGFNQKFDYIDFFTEDNNWKEAWGFEPSTLYEFNKS